MASEEQVKLAILESGAWQMGDFIFASRKRANNKFEMMMALKNRKAKRLLIPAMIDLVAVHEPDALFGVPRGGQAFADVIGKRMKLPVIQLKKVAGQSEHIKAFEYQTDDDQELAEESPVIVGIEDVTSELTSTIAALQLPELSENAVAIVAALCRGIKTAKGLRIPVNGVVEEAIPNVIHKDHPFYQQYGHFALQSNDAWH